MSGRNKKEERERNKYIYINIREKYKFFCRIVIVVVDSLKRKFCILTVGYLIHTHTNERTKRNQEAFTVVDEKFVFIKKNKKKKKNSHQSTCFFLTRRHHKREC